MKSESGAPKYETLVQCIEVELAEWRLSKAKGETNQWADGYMRALELVREWIDEKPCTGTCRRVRE